MRSSSTIPTHPAIDADAYERLQASRLRRRVIVIGAALCLLAALAFLFGLPSPGRAIRSDLAAAAAAVRTLPPTASPNSVKTAVHAALGGRDAVVDASGFPRVVAVTLPGLDRATCVEATETARRLEGAVVVELQGHADASACAGENDMTWRIMP